MDTLGGSLKDSEIRGACIFFSCLGWASERICAVFDWVLLMLFYDFGNVWPVTLKVMVESSVAKVVLYYVHKHL